IHVAGSDVVVARFNDHLAGKLLVFGDEAVWSPDRKGVQKLKSYITDPTIAIEPKFVGLFEIANFARFIFATNEERAAPVDLGDRRYVPLPLDEAKIGDTLFWRAFHQEMNGGGPAALLHHLLHEVRCDLDLRITPKTAALAQ